MLAKTGSNGEPMALNTIDLVVVFTVKEKGEVNCTSQAFLLPIPQAPQAQNT